jgi:DNA-binding transcriptional LysR family regulator
VEPGSLDLQPGVLQQYLILAEARDLKRAAGRLMISPAALRKSMRRLERQLGTRLFVGDWRALELTPEGDALRAPAQNVVSAAARFNAGIRSIRGVLRVAHSADVDTLALVLDRFAELHPDVRVEEQVLPCDAQLSALREREIDLALCRLSGAPPADCQVELVRLDPILAAVAPRAGVAPLSVDPGQTPVHVGETGGEWSARDELIASFEQAAGCQLHRVQVAVGARHEIAALERTRAPVFLTMSSSLAIPTRRRLVGLVPRQPYFAWSLVWPTESSATVSAFVETARGVAADHGWLTVDGLPGTPWLPEDDFDRLATREPRAQQFCRGRAPVTVRSDRGPHRQADRAGDMPRRSISPARRSRFG